MARSGMRHEGEDRRACEGAIMNEPRAVLRRIFPTTRAMIRVLCLTVIALNILGLVGFFSRDRSVPLALLLYLSMAPVGPLAMILGLCFRQTTSRRVRYFLITLGLISTATWRGMVGTGATAVVVPEERRLKLLHWNVYWGGLPFQKLTPWQAIGGEIIDQDPDLVVLSEAPFVSELYQMLDRLPGRRFGLSLPRFGKDGHPFHAFVSSRWPVRLEQWDSIADGGAAIVLVEHPRHRIRIMIVDGESTLTRLRTRMLHDIADTCARGSTNGEPIDLLVGDFNAVSRSIGFDEISASGGGYQLASRSCRGWRGTWPSFFPVLDIDHVWVRSGWAILGCRMFTNFVSDHRGQVVELGLSDGN